MIRRSHSDKIDGSLPAAVESTPAVAEMTPIKSSEVARSMPTNRHDPIGWLLKRLGVLFLVAVTIALVLLIALPHGHATTPPHQGHVLPKALSPGKL